MNHDPILDFVKRRLEEDEGISAAGLSKIMSSATRPKAARGITWLNKPVLVAASLAVILCAWQLHDHMADTRREVALANVIELLRAADGVELNQTIPTSLPESLQSWQDAPLLADLQVQAP